MSDLRPSCFCGKMTWAEWESLVSGIGWLIMHIARATFPTFWTYEVKSKAYNQYDHRASMMASCQVTFYATILLDIIWELTLLGKYDGSQTTFLHLAVSPSELTPTTFPLASNSTCHFDWQTVEINPCSSNWVLTLNKLDLTFTLTIHIT